MAQPFLALGAGWCQMAKWGRPCKAPYQIGRTSPAVQGMRITPPESLTSRELSAPPPTGHHPSHLGREAFKTVEVLRPKLTQLLSYLHPLRFLTTSPTAFTRIDVASFLPGMPLNSQCPPFPFSLVSAQHSFVCTTTSRTHPHACRPGHHYHHLHRHGWQEGENRDCFSRSPRPSSLLVPTLSIPHPTS